MTDFNIPQSQPQPNIPDHEPGELSPSLSDRDLLAIILEVMDDPTIAFFDMLEVAVIDNKQFITADQYAADRAHLNLLRQALRLAEQRTASGEASDG